MKLSTRGRYGVRVMMELAQHFGHGPVLVETIQKNQDISGKYIHNLVVALREAGLVRSVRGPRGGYALGRDPAGITILDIVRVLEGPICPVECVERRSVCARSATCATRLLWEQMARAMEKVLEDVTLEQLCVRQAALEDELEQQAPQLTPKEMKKNKKSELVDGFLRGRRPLPSPG